MCIFYAFLLNTGRKAFGLLSKNSPSLSLLMITIEWIGLVYHIYLISTNNIFTLKKNIFHGWEDGVVSLDMFQISNSFPVTLKWP